MAQHQPYQPTFDGNKMFLSGYIYVKSKVVESTVYYECKLLQKKECSARAVVKNTVNGGKIVTKEFYQSKHDHLPNHDECDAEKLSSRLKRKACENPERPPSGILRIELPNTSKAVLSHLPDRENLKNP